MSMDGSDLTKISDDVATFINTDDNYIYYVRNNPVFTEPFSFLTINTDSLCRLDRSKHKKSILLDSSASLYASLVGNKVYYLHYDDKDFTTFYEVGIDGTGMKQVDKTPYRPCSTVGQYICISAAGSLVGRTCSWIENFDVRRISDRCFVHDTRCKIPEIDIRFCGIDIGIVALCDHGVITAVCFHTAESRRACTVALEINIVTGDVIAVNAVIA